MSVKSVGQSGIPAKCDDYTCTSMPALEHRIEDYVPAKLIR
jgi:hypothetical protein